jgi:hypothetical protein
MGENVAIETETETETEMPLFSMNTSTRQIIGSRVRLHMLAVWPSGCLAVWLSGYLAVWVWIWNSICYCTRTSAFISLMRSKTIDNVNWTSSLNWKCFQKSLSLLWQREHIFSEPESWNRNPIYYWGMSKGLLDICRPNRKSMINGMQISGIFDFRTLICLDVWALDNVGYKGRNQNWHFICAYLSWKTPWLAILLGEKAASA